jgi:hypothetical protein
VNSPGGVLGDISVDVSATVLTIKTIVIVRVVSQHCDPSD